MAIWRSTGTHSTHGSTRTKKSTATFETRFIVSTPGGRVATSSCVATTRCSLRPRGRSSSPRPGCPTGSTYPPATCVAHLLTSSTTITHCPYDGWAGYWSMRDGTATDVAWSYAEPFADASMARDHLCFLADVIEAEVGPVAPRTTLGSRLANAAPHDRSRRQFCGQSVGTEPESAIRLRTETTSDLGLSLEPGARIELATS